MMEEVKNISGENESTNCEGCEGTAEDINEQESEAHKLWGNAARYQGSVSFSAPGKSPESGEADDVVPSPSLLPFTSFTRNRMLGYSWTGDAGPGLDSLHSAGYSLQQQEEALQSLSSVGLPTRVHRYNSIIARDNNNNEKPDDKASFQSMLPWQKYCWSKITEKTFKWFGRRRMRKQSAVEQSADGE